MPVVTSCPRCRAKYKVKSSAVGRKMNCRRCEKPFTVSASAVETDGQPDDEAGDSSRSGPKKKKKKSSSGQKQVVVTCADCGARFHAAFRQEFYNTPCLACNRPVPVPGKDGSVGPPEKPTAEKAGEREKPAARPQKQLNILIPLLIGAVCVIGVVGLLFLLPALSAKESGIEPPETYVVYKDQIGGDFHVDFPKGWTVEAGGRGKSNPWAKFKKGSATIQVKTSTGASILGDTAGGRNPDEDIPDELTAVAQIHTLMKDQYAGDFTGYEEQPAIMIKTGMGDGQLSEFTASGSWGSKLKGMRLTCLGLKYQFTVLCDCSESDWAVCRPIFEHVVKSLSR